jgi:hypothetical protein
VRATYEWIRPSYRWAKEIIKPKYADRRRNTVELYAWSLINFELQFHRKLCEAAHFIYYKVPLEVFKEHNLKLGVTDEFDVPIIRGKIEVDCKGSDLGERAALMPYSVERWNDGLFDSGRFLHLSMCRSRKPDPYLFEMCGWCTKEEFKRWRRLAPDLEYPQTLKWLPGTPFVPIAWLHPAHTLAPHPLPLTRTWVNDVAAHGLPATERVWADMKKRRRPLAPN